MLYIRNFQQIIKLRYVNNSRIKVKRKDCLLRDRIHYIQWKFYLYLKKIFNKQLSRAEEWLEKEIEKRKKQNDPSRFIKEDNFTKSAKLATDKIKTTNDLTVDDEIKYHGFLCSSNQFKLIN